MEGRGRCRGRGAALLAAFEAQKLRSEQRDESKITSTDCNATVGASVVSDPTLKPLGRAQGLLRLFGFPQKTLPPLVQSDSTRTNIPSNFSPQEKKVTDNLEQQRLNQGNQDSTEGTEKLTEQMTVLQMLSSSKLSSSSADQILRPLIQDKEIPVVKKGTWGTPVDLVANYIRINVDPYKGIFEYEVQFEPEVDSRNFRTKLLNQQQDTLGPARTFDGVTLYLPSELPDRVTLLESNHPVTEEVVLVKILFRQKKSASDCIHFYNILIRKIATILGMVQMNRSYYNPRSPIAIPEESLEVWPGYVTAVNEFEGGLMLCCDVSFRALRTSTVLDELKEMAKHSSTFKKKAQEVLVGLTVLTRYNNKTYRIDDIVFEQNPLSTFNCRGEIISYVDYYKKHYDIVIQDRGQPLLLNRLKKKMIGEEDVTVLVCLVPELCYLSGLDDRLRRNFTTMRKIATHTKVAPMERHQALVKYIQSVNNSEKTAGLLSRWGLSFDSAPLGLEGRVLKPEVINMGKSICPSGPQCDWGRNIGNNIITPVAIQNWILVVCERDLNRAKQFADTLIELSCRMGMDIKPPRLITLHNDRTDTFVNRIRGEINSELQLVTCIFPTMRDDRYNAVKTLCTAQSAVPSQMINSMTLSKPNQYRSVVQKIALQINCKLGGELWAVNIPLSTLMVCGVDVYHDPTRRGQSVVGFVASMNPAITRWYSRAKYQSPGQELVDTLKLSLMECLQKYYEENNQQYPRQIVLYRDGVGDGQLQVTIEHEVSQLVSAFKCITPPYEPQFSMVVVQKRIHTRFFLQPHPNTLKNVSPGTVLDHTVTRKNWWDFFLVSQHVNQGTVSPTHYVVVHDGGMSPDVLQKLSYKMTHMYYNWPGTIRVPAPCQYAHKLAYQVGENIRGAIKDELCNRLFFL